MLVFLKLLLVTTAWDLPVPGVGPQSSCVQTPELGHCSTPGDIIHEDKDAKRIPGDGTTGTMSPGFQSSSLPVMLAPGSGSMSWSPGALPALGLYPFCLSSHPAQGLCCTRRAESEPPFSDGHQGHGLLLDSGPSPLSLYHHGWLQPSQVLPRISPYGGAALSSDQILYNYPSTFPSSIKNFTLLS